jgi:hypothetical protein
MDSFCAAPWAVHTLNADGTAGICCVNHVLKAADHRTLMGSPEMADAIRRMRAGEPVPGCEKCYDQERDGIHSMRMLYNGLAGPDPDGHGGVAWFDLSLGNKCNQACRICGPHNSTGWIRDADRMGDIPWAHVSIPAGGRRIVDGGDRVDGVLELMAMSSKPFVVELKGGEPLYMESNRRLLREMVARGLHGKASELRLITNGTVADPEIIGLLGEFGSVNLALSVDGVGPLHTYTRGVALSWDECRSRWMRLASMRNITGMRISNTIYAYTVLGHRELAEWRDSEFGPGVPMADAVLHTPAYLGIGVLDADLRARAACRLPDGHPMAEVLLSDEHPAVAERRERFRVFTHRLDLIRGERLADIVPELAPLMEG